MICRNFTFISHKFATSVHSSEKEAHNELFKQIQDFKTEIKFPKMRAYGWANDIVLTLMHSLAEPDQENCCSKLLLLYFNTK